MNLVNEDFGKLIPNEFFTENVSLFLYSLIKCSRPQNIIEIGAGYSTLFLSKAIQDIQLENLQFNVLLETKDAFTGPGYKPVYTVIENFSHQSSIKDIKKILEDTELDKNINFIEQSIDDYLSETSDEYDFVWMDFGSGIEYMKFFKLFLSKLKEGGYIIVHSTMTNLAGRLFAAELKLMNNSSLEILSIVEPHKAIQNSFTIIKKIMDYPLYTMLA